MSEVSLTSSVRVGLQTWLAAVTLFMASFVYALVATTSSYQSNPGDGVDVFLAGALPGLVVILVLWLMSPMRFPRMLRAQMVGAVLAAPTIVALLALSLGKR